MGAFFLYKKGKEGFLNISAAREIFRKKGFKEPHTITFDKWKLMYFNKQLLDEKTYLTDEHGNFISSSGTWIYKFSSNMEENLKIFLNDFINGNLDCEELIGNYSIIIWNKKSKRLHLLIDPLSLQHVFTTSDRQVFSSSFLALLSALPHKAKLNDLAFIEKISTGYNVGPDTLVKDIFQVVEDYAQEDIFVKILCKHKKNLLAISQNCGKSFNDCVAFVAYGLKQYFRKFLNFADHYHPELGLSGGFDSRLVLSTYLNVAGKPLDIHTHLTSGVHDREYAIVRKISESAGIRLKVIPTVPVFTMSEEQIRNMLDDGLFYFDGRNSYDMGAFSEVYTRHYWRKIFHENKFSLSGLGGEIFRNDQCICPWKKFKFDKWASRYMFYFYNDYVVADKEKFHEMKLYLRKKIFRLLDMPDSDTIDFQAVRRYYSEVRMPFCDGVNINAHDQLAFFFTPFIDIETIRLGYAATKHIGVNGEFEANLIKFFSPTLAEISSQYGFPFSKVASNYKLGCFIREICPYWVYYISKIVKVKYMKREISEFEKIMTLGKKSPTISKIITFIKEVFGKDLHLEYALRDTSHQQSNILYIGYFLLNFSDKIVIDTY